MLAECDAQSLSPSSGLRHHVSQPFPFLISSCKAVLWYIWYNYSFRALEILLCLHPYNLYLYLSWILVNCHIRLLKLSAHIFNNQHLPSMATKLAQPQSGSESETTGLTQLLSAKQSAVLAVIEDLRHIGNDSRYEIDLPRIIVCGDQSCGKSSVLEAIS